MAETTAFLSPNGQNLSRGPGPATRLQVGTVDGLATLTRTAPGAPWQLTGRSLAERHIGALLFEPRSGKLLAGTHAKGGLWISDDGDGQSWRQVEQGLDRPHVYSLAARHERERVTLFLGTSPAALYRSDDLGESWIEHKSMLDVPDTDQWTFPPPPHIPHVKAVVFHPSEADTFYVLIEQGALLKTTDDGQTWTEIKSYSDPEDDAYRDLHRMIIDDLDPDRIFLATGVGVYRSGDGGRTWDRLSRRGESRLGYPDFLYFDPRDRQTVYAGGSHLNPSAWFKTGIADSSVLVSNDSGQTWTELHHGLPKPVVGAFEAMGLHHWPGGRMLTIGTATGEVFASEDGGQNWECICENVGFVSKDDHHFPFMPPAERGPAVEAYRAANGYDI